MTEYFSLLSGALIAVGLILLAWSRGVHIKSLSLFALGSVPIKRPIDIPAWPRLFRPSISAIVLGVVALAITPATKLTRQTYDWYHFKPITNMTPEDLSKCKSARAIVGESYVDNPNLDQFVGLVVAEFKRCARETDYDNTGVYAEKYLAAVGETPGKGWVCAFVSWAIKEANLDDYVEISSESAELKENFRSAGLLIEGKPDAFMPADIVFVRATEDQPNSIFPTVLIGMNDKYLLLVSGNNRRHGFEFDGEMVGMSQLPKTDRRIDSVGRFKVERGSPEPASAAPPAPTEPPAAASAPSGPAPSPPQP